MTCDEVRGLIIDALAFELSDADRQSLDQHLSGCEGCRALALEYHRLWADLPQALEGSQRHGLAQLRARAQSEFAASSQARDDSPTSSIKRARFTRIAAVVALLGTGVIAGVGAERLLGPGNRSQPAAGPAVVGDATQAGEGGESATDDGPTFVLLFYAVPGDADQRRIASQEIDTWARALFREGVVVDGAEMGDTAGWVGPVPAELGRGGRLTHYITIRATDLEHARQIALTAPVVARQGVVEVRPLD